MKKTDLKQYYYVGDLVRGDILGIVIAVTRNKITVKHEYGTSVYSDIKDINSFKHELKVLAHIRTVIDLASKSV